MPRTLHLGSTGKDVEAAKRAVYRYVKAAGQLEQMQSKPLVVRRFFGPGFASWVNEAHARAGQPRNGTLGPLLWEELRRSGAIDAYAQHLLDQYAEEHQHRLMVYPHIGRSYCGGAIHTTAGLIGNIALDFLAPGGTPVVAVEDAKIRKLSGRNPSQGADQVVGIFGWSLHFETAAGYRYFATHFGDRRGDLYPGLVVKAGELLGHVGNWPGDPGRSHTHLGVTSPLGERDARKRIEAVAASPRITEGA